MKLSTLTICLCVWLISLTCAYFIGSRVNEASYSLLSSESGTSTQTSIDSTKEISNIVNTEEPNSLFKSYFEGDLTVLEEAIREIPTLSSESSSELLDAAFELPKSDPNRRRLIRELLSQLAETEPRVALELSSQINSLQDSERARMSILRVWGKNDPVAALTWSNTALTGEPTRTRHSQIAAIYRGYAQSNPEAAFQQAMNTEQDERLRNRLLCDVIEIQVENGGLMAAKLKVDLISDSQIQNNVRRRLINEWAGFDPESASNYVLALGDSADANLKSTLVGEWAESDPAAAAAWLTKLPKDDPSIARASAEIIQEWTRYDLTASAKWLNSLPPSPELDRAVISYTFRAVE
ncbi:MAG: hypothetical protein VXZ83_01365, partial [Verrucomicrobiota bacterium]|nr:hypothetical protein [Verrucomicrobiota bacterium]